MHWFRTMGWAVVVALVVMAGPGQGQGDDDETAKIMKKKLTQAQSILEGITVNDFDKVTKSSKGLIEASKQAAWYVLRTPQYELYSDEFRRSAQEIIKAAEKKNTEGAALGYVDLTLTCVKCHEHVRERGIGQLPAPVPPVRVALPRTIE